MHRHCAHQRRSSSLTTLLTQAPGGSAGAAPIVSTQTPAVSLPSQGSSGPTPANSSQLVSFRLADEEYGIEITKVQEIILLGEVTRIPQSPVFIKGLINLRSTVIPIVDLRLRFGLLEQAKTDEARIMVVNVRGKTIGLIVDAVSEVLRIQTEQIAPPPPTIAGLGRDYLTGLVKLEKRLLILLDVDKLLEEAAFASA
jgi:purine-binding chemotaxis protein CheW